MAFDPLADHGRELPYLETNASVFPRCDAEGVFVQASLRAAIGWIEAAIKARLREEIDGRSQLRVKEQRQSRVKEVVPRLVDQIRRRLVETVVLRVGRATDAGADLVVEGADAEPIPQR